MKRERTTKGKERKNAASGWGAVKSLWLKKNKNGLKSGQGQIAMEGGR